MSSDSTLSKMVRKMRSRTHLDEDDCEAIAQLPYVERVFEAPAYLIREGEPARPCCSFITDGFAFRQKITAEGARQIVSIHMAGDFLDLQHLFLSCADHSVQALTRLHVAEVERSALQALILSRPAIGRAMWTDALVDASIFREWVLNVGRRNARGRVAHLLCEFALRMRAAGIEEKGAFKLPMTQEQLGDAVGLTSVHVNRTLKSLEAEGLIERSKRYLSYADWERLRDVGDFSSLYLHLDNASSG